MRGNGINLASYEDNIGCLGFGLLRVLVLARGQKLKYSFVVKKI